jgi:hypothetical protein
MHGLVCAEEGEMYTAGCDEVLVGVCEVGDELGDDEDAV